MKKLGCLALTGAALLIVASGTPVGAATRQRPLTGLGATKAAFIKAHTQNTQDHCDVCYGASVKNFSSGSGNSSGWTSQFGPVDFFQGIVDAITVNMPNRTSIASAQEDVTALLPTDAVPGAVTATASNGVTCGFQDFTSTTIANLNQKIPKLDDPQGVVQVEYATLNTAGNAYYSAKNVQQASVEIGSNSQTAGCQN
jgi:hypothetical protein